MGALQGGYATYFNLRHRRNGHLTQGRYNAWLVESDEYLLRLSRYIHLNPVWVKGVKRLPIEQRREVLRNYRWSSYAGYVTRRKREKYVEYGPILAQSGGKRSGWEAGYRRYVEAGLARSDDELAVVQAGARLAIGSEEFVRRMEELYDQQRQGWRVPEDVAFRRVALRLTAAVVVETVAEVFEGMEKEQLLRRRRDAPERAVAAVGLRRFGGLTQRAIGRELGMGSGSAVSQQIKRLELAVIDDRVLRRKYADVMTRLAAKCKLLT